MADDVTDQRFTAFHLYPKANMGLTTAPLERDWMSNANMRFPYRCLPLNIANQSGWFVTSPVTFELYYYGGAATTDIELKFHGHVDPCISSHFGYGVLTFSLPYLFRTPPGMNLWVKGPSNLPKDGIQPLEGVVETDWAFSTFTMNWKVTRPFEWLKFEKDEPICMLVPIPRGLHENLVPESRPIESDDELHAKYRAWEASRRHFISGLTERNPEIVQRGWQKEYFKGQTAEGGTFDGHQTRLNLAEFPPLTEAPAT